MHEQAHEEMSGRPSGNDSEPGRQNSPDGDQPGRHHVLANDRHHQNFVLLTQNPEASVGQSFDIVNPDDTENDGLACQGQMNPQTINAEACLHNDAAQVDSQQDGQASAEIQEQQQTGAGEVAESANREAACLCDCPVCGHVYREPHIITACGHTFCRDCIARLQPTRCPICRTYFSQSAVQPNFALRDIVHNQPLRRQLLAFEIEPDVQQRLPPQPMHKKLRRWICIAAGILSICGTLFHMVPVPFLCRGQCEHGVCLAGKCRCHLHSGTLDAYNTNYLFGFTGPTCSDPCGRYTFSVPRGYALSYMTSHNRFLIDESGSSCLCRLYSKTKDVRMYAMQEYQQALVQNRYPTYVCSDHPHEKACEPSVENATFCACLFSITCSFGELGIPCPSMSPLQFYYSWIIGDQ